MRAGHHGGTGLTAVHGFSIKWFDATKGYGFIENGLATKYSDKQVSSIARRRRVLLVVSDNHYAGYDGRGRPVSEPISVMTSGRSPSKRRDMRCLTKSTPGQGRP